MTDIFDKALIRNHTLIDRMRSVRGEIASIASMPRLDAIGHFEFLNYTMSLVRQPLAFMGIQQFKFANRARFAFVSLSVQDEALRTAINEENQNIIEGKTSIYDLTEIEGKRLITIKEKERKNLIRVFDTDFYIAVMLMKVEPQKFLEPPKVSYHIQRKGDFLHALYETIFCSFGDALTDIHLSDHIQRVVQQYPSNPVRNLEEKRENKDKEPFVENILRERQPEYEDQCIVHAAKQKLAEIIEQAQQDIYDSPLLREQSNKPINALISAKIFDRVGTMRYVTDYPEGYKYNPRLFITKGHRKKIIEALQLLHKVNHHSLPKRAQKTSRLKSQWILPYNVTPDDPRPSQLMYRRKCFGDNVADAQFWKDIKQENYDAIVDGLTEHTLSENIRMFSDYSLRSGASQILQDPFDGLICWKQSPDDPEKDAIDNTYDLNFFARLHYLLNLIGPIRCKTPALVTAPILINASSALSFTRIRSNEPDLNITAKNYPLLEDPKLASDLILNQGQWQYEVLTIDRIITGFERHIRRMTRRAYLQLVADTIIAYVLSIKTKKPVYEDFEIPNRKALRFQINTELDRITRVFPYENIHIAHEAYVPKELKDCQFHQLPILYGRYGWIYTLLPNRFFDRLTTDRSFITPARVDEYVLRACERADLEVPK